MDRDQAQFWDMPWPPRDDVALVPPMPVGIPSEGHWMDWRTQAETRDINTRVPADGRDFMNADASAQGRMDSAVPGFQSQMGIGVDGLGSLNPFADQDTTVDDAAYTAHLAQGKPINPFADLEKEAFPADSSPAMPPRAHRRSFRAAGQIPVRSIRPRNREPTGTQAATTSLRCRVLRN